MEEGINKLKEFHCASNTSQPVHISYRKDSSNGPIGPLSTKKTSSKPDPGTLRFCYTKARSNTMRLSKKSSGPATDNINSKKLVGNSVFLFRPPSDTVTSTPLEENKSTFFMASKSEIAEVNSPKNSEVTKSRSATDCDSVKGDNNNTQPTEQQLQNILTESLSPSPFRNEDPTKREARLEHLVTSAPCTTKSILFSTFYGSEFMGEDSHRAWKIALKDHIVHTLESICMIKNLSPVPLHIIEKKKLPVDPKPSGKKLVVFDLDETLVHCLTTDIEKADKIVTINLNTNDKIKAGVNIRPHVVECLKQLSEYYELIVFTASHPYYADTVIDLLDPDKKIFSKRLFRNSCIKTDVGLYIKDLRVLNCDLKSTVIVDNAIFSFAFQLDNGIPIIPFYDDKEDKIMPKIKDYLISLKDLEDVRVINKKTFSLTELIEMNISSFLKYYYDDPVTKDKEDTLEEDKTRAAEGDVDIEDTDEKLTPVGKRRNYSFAHLIDAGNNIKITKKAQAEVEDQLVKLRESLPKYLASQKQEELLTPTQSHSLPEQKIDP